MLKTILTWTAAIAALCLIVAAVIVGAKSISIPIPQADYQSCLHPAQGEQHTKPQCETTESLWDRGLSDPIAYYTLWLTFFTLALAVVGIVSSVFTGQQIRLSREEFIATHRPDIILREPRFEWVGEKQIVRFFLVNRGDGAGTVIDSRIGLEHHEDIGPALNMLCNGSNDLGHIALASGEIRECEWTVPGAIQLMRVAADEPTLGLLGAIYLMGSLDYVDGSGRRRRTVFCRKYDPRRRRFVPTGDPEHEYAD